MEYHYNNGINLSKLVKKLEINGFNTDLIDKNEAQGVFRAWKQ